MPLVPVSQILAGCFIRWRLPDWSCYSNTNSLAQTEIKWAAHQRLLDWSWSQQNREKPKGQLGGDCLTGLVHNRNGENQRGSSPETARLVLVPTETGKTNSSSPETARPVLVTQPEGKTINPGSSPETARLVLVPTETEKTNSSSPETARPVLVTQPKGKTINP